MPATRNTSKMTRKPSASTPTAERRWSAGSSRRRPTRSGRCWPTAGCTPPGWWARPASATSILGWPQVGSRIHHSVGLWPALLDDTTHVLACREGAELAAQGEGLARGRGARADHPHRRTCQSHDRRHRRGRDRWTRPAGTRGRSGRRSSAHATWKPCAGCRCWPRGATGRRSPAAEFAPVRPGQRQKAGRAGRCRRVPELIGALRLQQPRPRRPVHPATQGACSALRP